MWLQISGDFYNLAKGHYLALMTSFRNWIFWILLMPLVAKAQNHANQWFFGNHAGINFNSGLAVATSQGMQNTFEGGSSYCDHNGNLLFYSDGLTVWNRNHQVMTNGAGLMGGQSSTTSALVVRHPSSCQLYYLFTVQDHQSVNKSLRYSIIDMTQSGGLGAVMVGQKNVLISNNCAEKIVAIRHQNGVDSWIVTHYLGNSNFGSYLLSSSGLSSVPVISTVGSVHGTNCMIGFLKSNHAGSLLISNQMFCSRVEMFDFNRSSGAVTNPRTLLNNLNGTYGAEFSPNDQILYLSKAFSGCALYQVDPLNLTNTYLVASTPGDYHFGGLQIGPDGKIYLARNGISSLGVINSPNVWGAGCGFAQNGFSLSPGTSSGFGIVSFATDQVNSYSPGGYQIETNDTCYGSPTSFVGIGIVEYDSIVWSFGDPLSGSLNYDNGLISSHYYTSAGVFLATMIVYGCEPDTITVPVNVLPCILPREMDIHANGLGTAVSISWVNSSEGRYTLERSVDGWAFDSVFSFDVPREEHVTSFLDKNVTVGATYYYRMRKVSTVEEIELSRVVKVLVDGVFSIECVMAPSIVNNEAFVRIKCDSTEDVLEFEMFDLQGRLLLAGRPETGGEIDLDLAKIGVQVGMYFVVVRNRSSLRVYRLLIR